MKQIAIPVSLTRIITAVFTVGIIGFIGAHHVGSSSAATTNHLPTGSFGALSCVWDGTKNDYKYAIPASWSDADKTATSNYYVYLGDKNSVGNYGGYNSSTAGDAIDRTSHTGSSYTWVLYRGTLTDARWPVKLWVNDIGGSGYVDTVNANRPTCPGTGVSLKVNNAATASVTTNANVTLSWASSNSSSCTAGGSWSGGKALSGSQVVSVGSPAGARSYTLTCGNAYASSATSVSVTVTNPPSGGGTGGSGGTGGTHTNTGTGGTKNTVTTTTAAPSSNADATAAVGTTSAVLLVPAGNAAKLHLVYNIDGGPSVTTDDVAVIADPMPVTLTDLQAKSSYSYVLVRTNGAGTAATSPAATFTTLGYDIQLHFIDNQKHDLAGIVATINDDTGTQATSDSSGELTFSDLADGKYTISFSYNGHKHTYDVDTSTSTAAQLNDDGSPADIVLTNTLNVDKLTKSAGAAGAKKSGGTGVVVLVVFLLLLLLAAAWFGFRWWRKRRMLAEYAALAAPAAAAAPVVSSTVDEHTVQEYAKHPAAPLPEHAGESLRDMVIKSMHQQAVQRANPATVDPTAGPTSLPPATGTPPPVAPPLPAPITTQAATAEPAPKPAAVQPPVDKPAATSHPKTTKPASHKDSDDGQTLTIHHDK